jgi:DNA-binding PadR family transcriptional regulator
MEDLTVTDNRLSDLQKKILIFVLQKKFATSQELIQNFWGDTSNKDRYASAHSSLSRSLSRLWRVCLIECWKTLNRSATAITLTDKGVKTAEKIMRQKQIS